ncbi:PD40 domain-containing protein [Pacificimonas sp. WHA3]|uniref:PD40 domain-containing protein n=1 Tax=Pacificimonas pallii TaxID=2827236 RepID=A0ABS6SBG7_9SPHN|nr:amidohydrolase family protein [Pacificimonas pallii]MBV7255271.1 PD40 domain-containing protein [Pacificimonas pallii]
MRSALSAFVSGLLIVQPVSAVAGNAASQNSAGMPAAAGKDGWGPWDITQTRQPQHSVSISVDEGSWMSLDVSPDGKTIIFDLLGDLFVMGSGGGTAEMIAGGPAMQRMPRFSPDGDRILFISDRDGWDNVWSADPDGDNPKQLTHYRDHLVMGADWAASDKAIAVSVVEAVYAKSNASQLNLHHLDSGEVEIAVPTPQSNRDVQSPDFSKDGRFVYYTERLTDHYVFYDANHMNFAVKRRDLKTGVSEEIAGGFGGAAAPTLSPNGKALAFVRRIGAKTGLFIIDLESRAQRLVFDGLERDLLADFIQQGGYYPKFAWFPDGKSLAVWHDGKIFRIDAATGGESPIPFRVSATHTVTTRLAPEFDAAPTIVRAKSIRTLAPSPGGDTLAATALGRVWMKDGTGVPVPLTKGDAWEYDPAWSPDGRSLAYVDWNDQSGSRLMVMRPGRGPGRTIASSSGAIRDPAFSPDGSKLVYRIQENDVAMGGFRARTGIYVISAKGGEAKKIQGNGKRPTFSADGEHIIYEAAEGSDRVIRAENINDGSSRDIAHGIGPDTNSLTVSPDQKWVAYRHDTRLFVEPLPGGGDKEMLDGTSAHVLSSTGGTALAWSADSSRIYWTMGETILEARVADLNAPARQTRLDLAVPADVPQGTIALRGAKILTMDEAGTIPRGTVIVSGNRIVAVGAEGQVDIPADAKVIDVTGKVVMPGMLDLHGHVDCCFGKNTMPKVQPSRYAQLAFGITTNFDPYSNHTVTHESAEATLAGRMVGPRWIASGSVAYGRPGKGDASYVPIRSYADALGHVERTKAQGGSFIKSYKQPFRRQRQMLIKAGREAGIMIDSEGESAFYVNLTAILDGATNLEHNLPLENYYDDIVQLMAGAKTHNTPVIMVAYGELYGEDFMYQNERIWDDARLNRFAPEVISSYSPLEPPYGGPPRVRGMTTIHAADELYDIGFRAVSRATKRLADAGVTINAGSHGNIPGLGLHWELVLLAEGGMAPIDVLRTATINGARTIGLGEQLGSITEGKLADIIVLSEDPTTDIRNSRSVAYTMVNGRIYDAETMNEVGNYDRPRKSFYWEVDGVTDPVWDERSAGH